MSRTRYLRNIALFYDTEAADIRRATQCDALPPAALRAKYAALKTKRKNAS